MLAAALRASSSGPGLGIAYLGFGFQVLVLRAWGLDWGLGLGVEGLGFFGS